MCLAGVLSLIGVNCDVALCLFVTVRACRAGDSYGLFGVLLGGFMRGIGWYFVKTRMECDWTPYLWNGDKWNIGGYAGLVDDWVLYDIDERRIVREVE